MCICIQADELKKRLEESRKEYDKKKEHLREGTLLYTSLIPRSQYNAIKACLRKLTLRFVLKIMVS